MARLCSYGFDVGDHELFTPAVAAAAMLRERGVEALAPFVATELLDDLAADLAKDREVRAEFGGGNVAVIRGYLANVISCHTFAGGQPLGSL